jgi:hypothetical protein
MEVSDSAWDDAMWRKFITEANETGLDIEGTFDASIYKTDAKWARIRDNLRDEIVRKFGVPPSVLQNPP